MRKSPEIRRVGRAECRWHRGTLTLFLDGQPAPALAYMSFRPSERYVRAFARAGVRLFSFLVAPSYDYYRLSPDSETAPGRFDYSWFDEQMTLLRRAAPDANVFPRLYLCSPPWWDAAHPADLLRGKDGLYNPKPDFGWIPAGVAETTLGAKKMTVPSLASRAWRRDCARSLRAFLQYAENRYGDRIVGYHLTCGGSQEWYYWGAFEDTFPDTSEPQRRAFRSWLRRHDLPPAPFPSAVDRQGAERGVFRDPARGAAARAIAYWRFHSELLVETMRYFARVVREVVGPQKFVGVFYGYLVDLQRHRTCLHNSGHLALRRFLISKGIHFNASPTTYRDRRAGRGCSVFNSATESHFLHGKFWWNENDILTHLAPQLKDPLFYRPRTPLETQHTQRREFVHTLCRGGGMWWFDMWGGYYADAHLMADVRRMVRIARVALAVDRSPVAEVVVAVDDDSMHFTATDNRLSLAVLTELLLTVARLGCPYAVLHVDDLATWTRWNAATRLIIFPNLYYADERRMERVRRMLSHSATTVLFVYAAGIFGSSPQGLTRARWVPERMEALTQIPLRIRRGASQLTWDPMLEVDDPTDPSLPQAWNKLALRAGWAVRRAGSRAVSACALNPPVSLSHLRELARLAGVHLYVPAGYAVYANRSFLGVCGPLGSQPRLRLPESAPAMLYDVFRRRELRVPATVVRLPPAEDGVWLFFRGSADCWSRICRGL